MATGNNIAGAAGKKGSVSSTRRGQEEPSQTNCQPRVPKVCINIHRRPLPWRCLYPRHLLTVLVESCAYSLFVLEPQRQNGSSSGLMPILSIKVQVGYQVQGKQLVHSLS